MEKIPFNVQEMNVDVASLSAHKMYGPKGVGALYVRRRKPRVLLHPMIDGGGHERGMRSGTLNVPGIVGFGKACEIASQEMPQEMERLRGLRDRLTEGIHAYVEGESLLMTVSDIAVSSGSACTSASLEPSYVLKALGVGEDLAHTSIRFGLGRFNTEEEVDYVIDRVVDAVTKLRAMSPLAEMAQQGIDLKSVEWAEG